MRTIALLSLFIFLSISLRSQNLTKEDAFAEIQKLLKKAEGEKFKIDFYTVTLLTQSFNEKEVIITEKYDDGDEAYISKTSHTNIRWNEIDVDMMAYDFPSVKGKLAEITIYFNYYHDTQIKTATRDEEIEKKEIRVFILEKDLKKFTVAFNQFLKLIK